MFLCLSFPFVFFNFNDVLEYVEEVIIEARLSRQWGKD